MKFICFLDSLLYNRRNWERSAPAWNFAVGEKSKNEVRNIPDTLVKTQ